MGGGQNPNVDLFRSRAAHGLEPFLLEDPQQPRLKLGRELTDLVEEQGSAVGEREPTLALARRAGEGALLVAEELALDQIRGNRGAIDGDERPILARRPGVNGAGHELLPGSGLTQNQDGGVGRRHLIHFVQNRANGRTAPEDLAGALQLAKLGAQGKGLCLKRGDATLGFAAVVDVAQDERVVGSRTTLGARQGGLRRKEGARRGPGLEAAGNPG